MNNPLTPLSREASVPFKEFSMPFPEIYTYTEEAKSEYSNIDFSINEIFKKLLIPFYFIQGIIECLLISIDVGIHSLFYNANKLVKHIKTPDLKEKPILEKVALVLDAFFQRVKLSAKSYIIDHWIFQKDCTKEILKESDGKHPCEANSIKLAQSVDSLILENKDSSNWVLYIPGMCDSHQVSYKHLCNTAKLLKTNIICPNPVGVGTSSEICLSQEDYYKAAEKAFNYLMDIGVSKENITIWGHSLGGSSAANLAAKNCDVKVILDRTFSSFENATTHFPYAPFPCNKLISSLVKWALPVTLETSIKTINPKNLLIISAQEDNVIDFNHASAKNLDVECKKIYCQFTDSCSVPSDRLTLSHSMSHTPKILEKINSIFIKKAVR